MEGINNKQVLQNKQKETKWTHFISLPLTKPHLVEAYKKLKSEITSDDPDLEPFFLGSSKAHITLNMLELNEEQVEKIQKILPLLHNKLPKFNITFKGWGYFGKKPEKSKYLYLKISNGLQEINDLCNKITAFLVEHDILNPQKQNLHNIKLIGEYPNQKYQLQTVHATFMKSRTKDTFDCSEIINKYSDFEISGIDINQLHCSIIQPQNADLYYNSLCVINLI
ncbi:AKAP7 2'5' RNA ligase-like domain protein (macronuclear) [Tetrahymena thermophila SB210]|uniref:AKAP7 2'5' RNA ligase-like domain protein n=1 Tax=Tetrahymena thermophila (strain SB210) TaxID=312017 RepID=Q23QC4_TETTS|nr:AKAP7 2'5' RNA ligase-like domain protein [Tetrahymena thermophila SB210]EAR98660.1 AKAP7 2'5' RNA ligase-like domain protein [Tetrahymena thermophila SB210]|eukprot:XP_001018905.1 AKAP7 2'5' RNA ligase-like domain protein [Tetrahymena thermophila SB210]